MCFIAAIGFSSSACSRSSAPASKQIQKDLPVRRCSGDSRVSRIAHSQVIGPLQQGGLLGRGRGSWTPLCVPLAITQSAYLQAHNISGVIIVSNKTEVIRKAADHTGSCRQHKQQTSVIACQKASDGVYTQSNCSKVVNCP